ncbi:predicted protein [Uncinocarpus reesii 1704]|uniref:Histone-lysine N-methyltransferase SET5 n=1 Tax=Uncinocarpus reesii (strain UAMH 1704) TaxID=336963 RepID=C4K019_UNCRE|nr:uncharacterized protein UREG_07770 [Uncinocarpus reesii 1704]EEP82905.1 predicted protein [Uncinocarpus reesii 1704]
MPAQDLAPPPPAFPERPDLFNEVEWGPFPTDQHIRLAYKLWYLQDGRVKTERLWRASDPPLGPEDDHPDTCLARNVYESLMQSYTLPPNRQQQDIYAQYREREYCVSGASDQELGSERAQGWSYLEIFGSPDRTNIDEPPTKIEVSGLDINSSRWRKADLQHQLRIRRLDTNGTVAELKERLYNYERKDMMLRAMDIDMGSLLPRQDLPEWGLPRQDDFMLKISTQATFSPVEMYTWAILLSPYNPAYWTSRAYLHYQMGYFDLALGDAYRAQLLCDVLVNPLVRNSQPGLYARTWDAIERHILQIRRETEEIASEIWRLRDVNGVNSFIPHVRKTLHHIICLSLLALQCWEDYHNFENELAKRLTMQDRDNWAIDRRHKLVENFVSDVLKEKRADPREFLYESHYGHARGAVYPYCTVTDRTTKKVLGRINEEIIGRSQAAQLGPVKIEVRKKDDDQLGIFATEDILAGETVYADEPSIRGHLHDFHGPKEYRCENCNRKIDPIYNSDKARSFIKENLAKVRAVGVACECSLVESERLYWCPPPEQGEESSEGSGTSSTSSQITPSTQPRTRKRSVEADEEDESEEQQAKKPKRTLHHGTILSLMLREVFDITLQRRHTDGKPNLLAYEIDELFPLMGADKQCEKHLFPFSYAANIRVPFDILQCLGVDIFRDLTFDTWVIQLVLRKLLINAVPWDLERRAQDTVDTPESKELRRSGLRGLPRDKYSEANPTIRNLYIFPGVSLFNSTCPDQHNVNWDWDLSVPNRMTLWASRDIEKDEELFIPYVPMKIEEDFAQRMFGVNCQCRRCYYRPTLREFHRSLRPYGDSSSEETEDAPDQDSKGDDQDNTTDGNGDGSKKDSLFGREETSSEPFPTQRAMTPKPEDEGEYDEADFQSSEVEVKEHSGEPFTESRVAYHADELRTALKEAVDKLPRSRRATTKPS